MARKEQNNVDYFPFLCKQGDAMKYIDNKHEHGFAVWVKLLRALALKNFHFLDLRNKKQLLLLAQECKVSEQTLTEIISDLVEFDEIDREIWEQYSTVWNQKFIDNIQDAYKRRNNKPLTRTQLLRHLRDNIEIDVCINSISDANNTHSIVYNNKVNKSKVSEKETHTPVDSNEVVIPFWDRLIQETNLQNVARQTDTTIDRVKEYLPLFKKNKAKNHPVAFELLNHFLACYRLEIAGNGKDSKGKKKVVI